MSNIQLSKQLSFVLRHRPDKINIELDECGWVDVRVLVDALNKSNNTNICHADIENVVIADEKQRYTIKDNKIRANQGHSVQVNLNLKEFTLRRKS